LYPHVIPVLYCVLYLLFKQCILAFILWWSGAIENYDDYDDTMTFLSMYTLTARRSGRRDVSDAAFVPDVTVTWWLVVSLAPVGSSRDMLTMFVCLFVCVSVDLTHLSRFYVSALPLSELTMIHFGTYQLYCALLSGQFNFRN